MSKENRCTLANELIQEIATCGRRFFNYEGKKNYLNQDGFISYFKLKNGRVYFVDGYIHEDILTTNYKHFQNKFSQGGTMQALILDLGEYIRSGEATNANNGYCGVYCKHWDYPEKEMIIIQRKAVEIGFSISFNADLNRHDYL